MPRRAALFLLFASAILAGIICRRVFFPDAQPRTANAPAALVENDAAPDDRPLEVQLFDRIGGLLDKLRRNVATTADFGALRVALFADPKAGIAAIVRFLSSGQDVATTQGGLPVAALSRKLQKLFREALQPQPSTRPSAETWGEILEEALGEVFALSLIHI